MKDMVAGGELADRIYLAYSNVLENLPSKERIHFSRRAYRATGDAKLAELIKNNALDKTLPAISKYSTILEGVVRGERNYPKVVFKGELKSSNRRAIRRRIALKENPGIQFFRRYLMNLFQAKLMGLDSSLLAKQWGGYIATLKKVDFDELFINETAVTAVSSFAVNSAAFVSKLDVDPSFFDRFCSYVRGYYLDDGDEIKVGLKKSEFRTLVYNLTHIIIADSGFYQADVTKNLWINEFFAKNIDAIIERCNLDIVAEVGLCFKLAKQETRYARAVEKVEKYIFDEFDLVMLDKSNLIKREHTNCVVMLFLMDVSSWHQGPFFD